LTRRTQLYLLLALAAVALALPAAAAANSPATLFQADLTGTMTLTNTEAGPDASWTTTATFPLNATTKAGSGYLSTNPTQSDIWIPTGSFGASDTVYPFADPDFSITTTDPNSSLTTVGGGAPSECGPYLIDNGFDPELGVTTGAGAPALLLDWMGQALPEGGDTNQNGNANAFPGSCDTEAAFEMSSPLNDEGEGGFDLPWAAGDDSIRFSFSGVNPSAATQTLTGTSLSQTATATGQPDGAMGCLGNADEVCTDTYTHLSETLTLTKICTGTVTVTGSIVSGTCGSSPPPPPPTAPSHTKITKSKVSASKHTASFSFSATDATGYQCALAALPKKGHTAPKLKFASCKSPKSYAHLKKGKYEFAVRGVNAAGKDPHPASKSFKIS
jgi:hypothetical protein